MASPERPPGAPRVARRRLLEGAGAFSAPVLLSRILGLVREMAFAFVFGAGPAVDAFVAAFRLPNLLRDLFAENAATAAVVPVYADLRTRRGPRDAARFAGRFAGTAAATAAAIAIAGILSSRPLVGAIAPGFPDETAALAARLARIMFPYLVLVSIAAILQGVLQAERVFWTVGAAAALFNLAEIGAAFGLAPSFDPPITAMAYGVLVGGALQVAIQVVPLRRREIRVRLSFAPSDPEVRRAISLLVPAALGSAASLVMIFANTVIASFAAPGSVAYLNYAYRVMYLPVGLIGVAAGAVVLPALAEARTRGARAEARATSSWALRVVGASAGAAAAGLALLAGPICALLFVRGAFTPADAAATARALVAYAPTVLFASMTRVVASSFYARHDTRTPALVGVAATACAVALNLWTVFGLGAPFWAIAAGTSAASALNFLLLFAIDRGKP